MISICQHFSKSLRGSASLSDDDCSQTNFFHGMCCGMGVKIHLHTDQRSDLNEAGEVNHGLLWQWVALS